MRGDDACILPRTLGSLQASSTMSDACKKLDAKHESSYHARHGQQALPRKARPDTLGALRG